MSARDAAAVPLNLLAVALHNAATCRAGLVSPLTGFPQCSCGHRCESLAELTTEWRAWGGIVGAPAGKRVVELYACSLACLLMTVRQLDVKGWPGGNHDTALFAADTPLSTFELLVPGRFGGRGPK